MTIKIKFIAIIFFLLLGFTFGSKSYAASLSNASDQLSTSRPSAAAPITAANLAGVTQTTVMDLPTSLNNSALWLSSDSATFLKDTGETQETINVASMSAANTPVANQRIIFLTGATANTHHQGVTLITPITATHTIKFTTTSGIPSGGHIVLTFPGAGSNIASPSATGFSFNNIAAAQIQTNNATCSGWSIVTPFNTMDCTLSGAIGTNVTVTIEIGCLTNTSGTCTSFKSMLINPTKGVNAAGDAAQWKIGIKTKDNNSVDLDSSTVIAGIVESVQVQGTVEPYMTMTIAGTSGTVCSDSTNTAGLSPTATFVNLGGLSSGQRNISAQTIQIDTNGSFGYTLTATSSGHFINPASGIFLPDANTGNSGLGLAGNDATNGTNPAPVAITTGTPAFGIHPCGSGTTVPTIPTGWGSGGGASNKFANPWNSVASLSGFYALLSSTAAPSAVSVTTIEYAATVSSTTPAGIYTTVFTYVATASF